MEKTTGMRLTSRLMPGGVNQVEVELRSLGRPTLLKRLFIKLTSWIGRNRSPRKSPLHSKRTLIRPLQFLGQNQDSDRTLRDGIVATESARIATEKTQLRPTAVLHKSTSPVRSARLNHLMKTGTSKKRTKCTQGADSSHGQRTTRENI